jgi:hypothetical protein
MLGPLPWHWSVGCPESSKMGGPRGIKAVQCVIFPGTSQFRSACKGCLCQLTSRSPNTCCFCRPHTCPGSIHKQRSFAWWAYYHLFCPPCTALARPGAAAQALCATRYTTSAAPVVLRLTPEAAAQEVHYLCCPIVLHSTPEQRPKRYNTSAAPLILRSTPEGSGPSAVHRELHYFR